MDSDTGLPRQQHTTQKKLSSFKTLKPLAILIIILLIVLVVGTGGYLLGVRANQNASQDTQRVSFQISPPIKAQSFVSALSPSSTETISTPTFAIPALKMKIYRNERLGFEIKHSDFYQIVNETSDSVFLDKRLLMVLLFISLYQLTKSQIINLISLANTVMEMKLINKPFPV